MLGVRDLLKTVQSIACSLRTATANGNSVDLTGCDRCYCVINSGIITDGTHTFKLQDSPDNVNWTNVAAGLIEGDAVYGTNPALTNPDDNVAVELGYLGAARYLRWVVTVTGAPATGGNYEAFFVLSKRRKLPT